MLPALYRVSVSLHSFEANDSHQTLEEYVQAVLSFCAAAGRSSVQPICVLRLWNRDSAVLKACQPTQRRYLPASTAVFCTAL